MKLYKSLLFLSFVFACLLLIILHPVVLYPSPTDDEVTYYIPLVNGIHSHGISYLQTHPDTKPLSFILVEYLLNGSIVYTRILTYILIGITTFFIYRVTNSKLSVLYPLIPIFLNGTTLTDEIIPAMFIVMSLYYTKKSGIFMGLAAVFNPFKIFYVIFLDKKNLVYFVIIGEVFAGILLYFGLFFPYLFWLIKYESMTETRPISPIVVFFLLIFFIIGSKDKKILWYALVGTVPVITRPYFDYYYIVPYTVLFVGYLLTEKQNKEILLS